MNARMESIEAEVDQRLKLKVGAKERTFRQVKLSDCIEHGPHWLVQGLIERGTVTAVTGEPGSGKTFLLVDLATHIASGRSWFGRRVERGVVIYVAAEAAESTQRRAALVRRLKFDNADLPVLIVTEPALLGDDIHCATDREALERLVDKAATDYGMPVALLIVDTIAASMGSGNENLDGMQRLVGAANMLAARTEVAVILNHHPNTTGGSLRGHSSLRGTVSHGFEIKVQGEVRVLTGFKQRDAVSGRLLAYRLAVHDLGTADNFGDRATSCVVEECEVPTEESQADDRERTRLMLAIREVFAQKAPGGTVLRFGEILEATKARCAFLAEKAPDANKKAVGRALKALEVAGVVQRCQVPRGTYRLTQEPQKGLD